MNNQTERNQTAEISYSAPRPVNIGDVFYRVVIGENAYLKAPCRVCEGKREITVNGVTFKCPMCDAETKVLRVAKFVVRRYRVYKISDEINNQDWKPSNVRHIVNFSLYRKIGRGNYNDGEFRLTAADFARMLNKPHDDTRGGYQADGAIFDDYKIACDYAEKCTAYEMRLVDEYNAEHGTAYAPKFNAINDPK